MLSTLRILSLIIALAILNACSTLAIDMPFVYKIDINQGNIIDQDMVNLLKPTMSKRQVIYVLGSPLLLDPFKKNRWDYIYSEQAGGENRKQTRIALFFTDDSLTRIEGDLAPEANPAPPRSKDMTIDVPKRHLKKTLYEMIMGLFTNED